ncbi:MAG: sensor histidine kinase [Firmicutes bacterium]|nr:sensor histidine kinase [Bacillota bacterium]
MSNEIALENLTTICAAIPAAVIAIDTNCRIILFNKCAEALLGVSYSKVAGCDTHEIGLIFELDDNLLQRVMETRTEITAQETTIVFNKQQLQVILTATPLYDDFGLVVGAMAVIRNKPLVNTSEQRIQHLEALASIGEMTAGTIHEIRNPLTSISGFVQLLNVRSTRQKDETSMEYCRLITDEITHINNILSDFLTLAKPQANKFVKLNILQPIAEVMAFLYGEALMYGIELKQTLANEPLFVLGNNEKIREVLINLCRNAFQAMTSGGLLTLLAKATETSIIIEITDTGHGMTDETIANIFTPFFTTKESGTGLGLSVCQRIVREHQGEINVSSQLGHGTTFTLTFPRHKE